MTRPLRVGVLSTAQIVPEALLGPCDNRRDIRVEAVASRSEERARRFAEYYGIPRWYEGYEALYSNPELDLIYIATPNRFHVEHVAAALEAGRAVYCEKPLALDSTSIERVVRAASPGGFVGEAFHYRYHPLMLEAIRTARSGRLGELRSISASFCIPVHDLSAIHWKASLGGGAASNLGVYPIHLGRTIFGEEPVALEFLRTPRGPFEVEHTVEATLTFPFGRSLKVRASQHPACSEENRAVIVGAGGTMTVSNPFLPHRAPHYLQIDTEPAVSFGTRSTFDYQMDALVKAVRTRQAMPTNLDDARGNAVALEWLRSGGGLTFG